MRDESFTRENERRGGDSAAYVDRSEVEREAEHVRDALRKLPWDDATVSPAFEALGWLTGTIKGLIRVIEDQARWDAGVEAQKRYDIESLKQEIE